MLKIVTLKDQKDIATLRKDSEGSLFIEFLSDDSVAKEELENFIRNVEEKGAYLVGGYGEDVEEGISEATTKERIESSDERYLIAIKDMITRSKLTLNGERVRCLLAD